MTVFYRGKLKRTRSHEEVFKKIKTLIKPKGVTKLWSVDESENRLLIDFGDEKSETLVFNFNDKSIDGFCKVAFDDVDCEKQLEAFFNLFYSIKKLFSSLEIDDEYGLWEDFVDSKRFNIKLRELTVDETARVKKLYGDGFIFYKNLLWKIITDDINVPYEELDYPDYINHPKPNEKIPYSGFRCFETYDSNMEKWLDETAAYRDRGRIAKYRVTYGNGHGHSGYRFGGSDNGEVSELEMATFSFIFGFSNLFLANFKEYKRIGGIFCQKHGQVVLLFEEKFMPLFNAEIDDYEKCILAYRFMVSTYEYIGFKFVGKE